MKLSAGTIGLVVGGAVGGYLSWYWDNNLYAAIGVGAGSLFGEVIGWVSASRLTLFVGPRYCQSAIKLTTPVLSKSNNTVILINFSRE